MLVYKCSAQFTLYNIINQTKETVIKITTFFKNGVQITAEDLQLYMKQFLNV